METAPGIPAGLSEATVSDLPDLETSTDETGDTQPETTQPPKRKRKRGPNKKKAPEPATGEITDPAKDAQETRQLSTALGASFQMVGNVVAAVRGSDHWKVSDSEASQLGDAWAIALKPYMGRLAPYLPFATAAIVSVGVFAPKVQRDRELRAKRPRPLEVMPDVPRLAVASAGGNAGGIATPGITEVDAQPQPPSGNNNIAPATDPDAPHLAYEGGFVPPGETPPPAAETPASRRRRGSL